ncbi:MAG: TetR/AcrR family transcriptional regulator [Brevundimonas sp.]
MARTATTSDSPSRDGQANVRERILETASGLFYRQGVRAVGVDTVVAEAGVAKTSLYRHFPTKDDLIAAFLEREDAEFWAMWDAVSDTHNDDPLDELEAHMRWIGERLARPAYRGCPQLNVAAEFAEADHPARQVARRHKQALRKRLEVLSARLGARRPEDLGAQLAVVVNGAFVSAEMLEGSNPAATLLDLARSLVTAATQAA